MYLAWVYQADLIDMAIHDAVPEVDRVHIHFTHATKYSVGPTRCPAGREGGVEEPFQFMVLVPARRRRSKSVPS
jgi:hypothetical protein